MKAFGRGASLRWGLLLITPTILGLIILNIIPLFRTIYMAFHKTGAFGIGNIFVGFENFERLLSTPQIWQATWNTLRYTLLTVIPTVVISLFLAVVLNRKIAGKAFYRTIYFLPMVAAPAAVTMVWRWLYNTDFGLINYLLSLVGMGPVEWINDPMVAPISIAIIGIWSGIGYNMILFLSGLQEIPKDYYEAAELDGANQFQQFFKITLPLLSPTMLFVLMTTIISGMQVFDVIYMLISSANPSYDTTVSLVYLFYNETFKYGNQGYGSAIVIFLLILILILTWIQMKVQSKWVTYMGD